ncbi:DNA-binding transcriptional MerR regulator [Gracilibacillus halotolerans]|uniref:DNA-binding transcriptional MerR regulator n=1 Tax=Gracilibacillus halotolerans TaxID=74386 RepID=A0A841RTP1_9BACI|nr:MerR family transcriptional regulator [Gracilibacillus halotolerans]MBB6514304.1 DNA-binding transcriptional MerR regulator [Gracilibacillus halotolerans]
MDENQQNLHHLLDFELLNKLIVGIGEVSDITGIPTRKIRYWEEKGAIESEKSGEGSTRRYNYLNVKKMLLIQEMLDEGFTLDAAIKKVEKRMETLNEAFRKLANTMTEHRE